MATIKELLSKMIDKINGIPKKLSELEVDVNPSWNDLKDKPFGEIVDTKSITWDGVLGDKYYISSGNSLYSALVTDEIISKEELDGAIITMKAPMTLDDQGNIIYEEESAPISIVDDLADGIYAGTTGNGDLQVIVATDAGEVSYGEYIEKPGIYFLFSFADYERTSVAYFISEVSFETKYNKQLDSKYLPLSPPDWNQNDETASDYIKNRTHYEEKCILFDGQVEIIANSYTYPFDANIDIYIDIPYTVTFDGIEYHEIGFYNDTDSCYAIRIKGDNLDIEINPNRIWCYEIPSNGVHLLKIIDTSNTIVHQLDEKYIPDSLKNHDWNTLKNRPFDERLEEVTIDLNEYITEWTVADQTNSLIMTDVQLETDLGLYIGSKVKFVFDDKELTYTLEDLSAVMGEGIIGCGDTSSMMNGDLSTINFIFGYSVVDGVGMMQMILKGSTPTVANLISEVVVVDKLDTKFYDKSLPEVTENNNGNVAMVVDGKWTSAPIGRRWRVLYDNTTTDENLDSFFVNIDVLLGEDKINELLFQVELPDEVNDATTIKVGELNRQIEFNIPEIRDHIHIYMSVAEGEYFIVSAFNFALDGKGEMMFPISGVRVNDAPNLNYFGSVSFELFKYTDAVKIPNSARCRILGR